MRSIPFWMNWFEKNDAPPSVNRKSECGDPEVRAVDEVRVGRIDEHLPAVTARDVEPRLRVDGLPLRAVVLCAAPEPASRKPGWRLWIGRDRAVLRDVEAGPVQHRARVRVDRAVQVLPVGVRERLGGARAPAAVRAVPDAAVVPDQHVIGVRRIHRECVEVGMEIPTEVHPRRAAVGRAEDAARLRAEVITERAACVDDVRVGRIDLDDVVVEALRSAVVLDIVGVVRARSSLRPRGTCIGRLEDLADVMAAVRVVPVEPCIEDCRMSVRRVRDRDREPRRGAGEVRTGREAVHDLRPRLAGIGALVDRVAPERGVEDARVERVDLDVRGTVRLGYFTEERPRDAAVLGLPNAEAGVQGRCDAPGSAAATQDRDVQVVRVRRVDCDARDRDPDEVVAGDVRPRRAAVGRLQDPVAVHAVARERAFAGPGVDDRVVRRCDRQRADRLCVLVARPRCPDAGTRVVRPDAALGAAEDVLPVRRPDCERADAAAQGVEGTVAARGGDDRVRAEARPRIREGVWPVAGRVLRELPRRVRRMSPQCTGL